MTVDIDALCWIGTIIIYKLSMFPLFLKNYYIVTSRWWLHTTRICLILKVVRFCIPLKIANRTSYRTCEVIGPDSGYWIRRLHRKEKETASRVCRRHMTSLGSILLWGKNGLRAFTYRVSSCYGSNFKYHKWMNNSRSLYLQTLPVSAEKVLGGVGTLCNTTDLVDLWGVKKMHFVAL